MRFVVAMLAVAVAVTGCHAPMQGVPASGDMMYAGHNGVVAGPGPGVMGPYGGGECEMGMGAGYGPAQPQVVQVAFVGQEGMAVTWDVSAAGAFDSEPLINPGRYNFPSGAIYRLKLTNIPSRPGVELYPSLEVGSPMPRTQAFLAHNAMPVQFTEQDFDQVLSGNFVTKVIYLPDPEFQELAVAGVETLVSTRLDPGVDPVVEADRRGSVLGVIRIGNRDLQIPGSMMETGVVPAGFDPQSGMPMAGAPTMPGNYISGVTGPAYGMPMTVSPYGQPGSATLPMTSPAMGHPGAGMMR